MKLGSPDKELRDLRDKNYELAQHLQRWKAIASEREKEKLEYSKEIKFLRMHILQQRRTIASMVTNIIKELEEQSSSIVRVFGFLEPFQNQSAVDIEYVSNKTRSSPTNNIQHVQPMVQGHSILKPFITLARTIVETPPTCNLPSTTVLSPQRNTRPTVTARPLVQLLESFVPLQRLDMEVCRISDENINVRRPRENSYTSPDDNEFILNDSNGQNILREEFNNDGDGEMDMSMVVNQDPEMNGDVYSRINLPQINEELEAEEDTDTSITQCEVSKTDPRKNVLPTVSLVPIAVMHKQKATESSNIKNIISPQPGPSWQSDDSDENDNSTKNKKKKGRKRSKRKKKSYVESKNSKEKSTTSAINKENIRNSIRYCNTDDSDSENSVYNEKLNRMRDTKRVIDSLKPVQIVVDKLNMPGDVYNKISTKTNMSKGDCSSDKSISDITTVVNDSMEGFYDRNKSNQIANLSPETVRMIVGDVSHHGDNNSYDNISSLNTSTGHIVNSSPEIMRRRKFSEDLFSYEVGKREASEDRQLSGRSRRTAPKDYKEKSLNKKLRRN